MTTSTVPARTARRRRATSVRERDALDTLVEHDLAVERAVHRALRRDHALLSRTESQRTW